MFVSVRLTLTKQTIEKRMWFSSTCSLFGNYYCKTRVMNLHRDNW
ncbi:hypothetical protein Hanom_Chr06g00537561 [Helianthus anomalus]